MSSYNVRDAVQSREWAETFGDVERCDRGWIRRVAGGSCHLAGPDDASPIHHTYPTGYEPACGWCWLNATHSEEAHTQAVTR